MMAERRWSSLCCRFASFVCEVVERRNNKFVIVKNTVVLLLSMRPMHSRAVDDNNHQEEATEFTPHTQASHIKEVLSFYNIQFKSW